MSVLLEATIKRGMIYFQILVAATRLTVNTAVTEFQGKYLLASQWNAQQPVMGQQYLPYVLQYHMPKEGLTVCVDARTYGNDARFTRRSCRPNAEVSYLLRALPCWNWLPLPK